MGVKKDKEDPKKAVAPIAVAPGKPGAKGAAPVAPAPKGAPGARGRPGAVPEPVAAPEVVKEKKKEKISQKERPKSKKKHAKVQVWKMYKVENGKATRIKDSCPRCGSGTFLASYKTRKYCGKCGYSQIQQKQ